MPPQFLHESQLTSTPAVPNTPGSDWEGPQLVYYDGKGKVKHTLPGYEYAEYPRMMFKRVDTEEVDKKGKPIYEVQQLVVTSVDQEQDAVNDDWVRHPNGVDLEIPVPPPKPVVQHVPTKIFKQTGKQQREPDPEPDFAPPEATTTRHAAKKTTKRK